jgi:hypothetical protein
MGAADVTGTVAIGGRGGATGDGGAVTIDLSGGSITTLGGEIESTDPNEAIDSGFGIFAQSVGGGGGLSGNIGLGGAGRVDVEVGGAVTATGDGAQGVFAQSVAPDGSRKVTVTENGAVRTSGTDASGILAQSQKGATSTATASRRARPAAPRCRSRSARARSSRAAPPARARTTRSSTAR